MYGHPGSHTSALQAAGAAAAAEGGPDSRRMAAGLQKFVQQICGMYNGGFSSQRMLLQQSLASSQVGVSGWAPPQGHLALLSGHRLLLLLTALSPSSRHCMLLQQPCPPGLPLKILCWLPKRARLMML